MILEAVLHPSELPDFATREMSGTVCVVFDVLRATSSMVTALAHGVARILPAATIEEALEWRVQHPEALLGGERHGDRIEGFDLGNSPAEYLDHAGASIITTTTNGTIAVQACRGAEFVLIGALLNLGALEAAIRRVQPARLIAVCAGTGASLALEDAWGAGALLERFWNGHSRGWSDAAMMARALFQQAPNPLEALRCSANGRALLAKGRDADVEWCAGVDRFPVVGRYEAGAVRVFKWEEWSGR